MRAANAWRALTGKPLSFVSGWWPWRALAYVLLSAVLGVLLLVVTVVSLVFLPLWGIVVGAIERRRTKLLGFTGQSSGHVRVTRELRHNWLGVRLTEPATWRETAALLVDIVVGLLSLAVVFAQFAVIAALVAIPVVVYRGVTPVALFGDVTLAVTPNTWWPVIPIGLALLALFAYLNTGLASGQATLLRLLCGPRQEELEKNVQRLTRSRAALVEAFEVERRRIERDLHDGVQQELVTMAARLAMLSLELDDLDRNDKHEADARGPSPSTANARSALEAAQDQAEHAMATLRRTVRGIHPAVLTDHGLHAALHELADRTPVPVELDIDPFDRPPSSCEAAAYYFATEAITNAAKHTAATRVRVRARVFDGCFEATVTDNGHGGANPEAGTGLRGLAERAETLGGTFEVDSPVGGPTRLFMTVPLTVPLTAEGGDRAHTAR